MDSKIAIDMAADHRPPMPTSELKTALRLYEADFAAKVERATRELARLTAQLDQTRAELAKLEASNER